MTSTSWKTYHKRRQVVYQAQQLARSGQHADHTTIIPLLESLEGFEDARLRLEDRAIRSQLDRLCALARVSSHASTKQLRRRSA